MSKEKVHCLELASVPLDPHSKTFAEEIASQKGVKDVFLFPDSFTKEKYVQAGYKTTVPSSAAIVTDKQLLYPQFRSRGINCGMMAVALPIFEEDISDKFLAKLADTFSYSLPYYINYRLRLPFLRAKTDLSYKEFLNVLEDGALAIKEKLGIADADIEKLEWKGKKKGFDLDRAKKLFRSDWLNKRTVRMRYSFGKAFFGNHYFEVQVAEKENDLLGIKKGQVIVMFHSGCQSLEDVVREDLRENIIRSDTYTDVSPESEMYQAFFLAQTALINLISAYRATAFALIRNTVESEFGKKDSSILVERGHNAVLPKEDTLVYRHNAEKITEGAHAIVSGNHNHASYIVRGGKNTEEFAHTIDHGLGKVLDRAKSTDRATDMRVRVVRAKHGLRYKLATHEMKIPFQINKVEGEYMSLLKEKGIISEYTALRPIYNLKFQK